MVFLIIPPAIAYYVAQMRGKGVVLEREVVKVVRLLLLAERAYVMTSVARDRT